MTITKTYASKAAVAFVAFAMLFSLAFAPVANAQTNEALQAQITALLAQIAGLQAQLGGGATAGASCSTTFTRDLNMGATGADVMALQKFLNGDAETRVAVSGAGSAGSETQYYGPATAAAVSKFQVKYRAEILTPAGLVNPTGYFGPSTRAKANALCAATPAPSDDEDEDEDEDEVSGDLEGGAGNLDDADYVSKLSNEEVGEGQEDVEVAGLILEADGSDIELRAVNLNFSKGTAGSNFDKYADEVSIWFDGEEVARVDADEFEKNNNYDKTVSLDSGAIIREGDTGELVVAVSGISNLDSADATDTWTLEFESVRFVDAQGGIISDTSTGDINDGAGRTFSFENFASAANTEFKVTNGDDDINDTRVILVDDTDDTDNVELASFNFEVEGDSDVTIEDLPILFTGSGAGAGEIVNTVEVWADGELIGSESIASSTTAGVTVLFDNLDWTIAGGDTVEVVIKGDLNDTDGAFGEGDTLTVTFGETQTDLSTFDIVDENGDDLADADKTGSGTSDAHLFYTIAPEISVVSTSIVANDNGNSPAESATAKIVLKLTARGGTLYLNGDNEGTENKRFFVGAVYGSGVSASTTASTTTFSVTSGTEDVTNNGAEDEYWQLDEGESMTIEVESIVSQGTVTTTAVLAGLKAALIQFGTDSTSDTTRSATDLTYTDLINATQSGTASLVNAS